MVCKETTTTRTKSSLASFRQNDNPQRGSLLRKAYEKDKSVKLIKQLNEARSKSQFANTQRTSPSRQQSSLLQSMRHPLINEFIQKDGKLIPSKYEQLLNERPGSRLKYKPKSSSRQGGLVNFYKQVEMLNQDLIDDYSENNIRGSSQPFSHFRLNPSSSIASSHLNQRHPPSLSQFKNSRPTTAGSSYQFDCLQKLVQKQQDQNMFNLRESSNSMVQQVDSQSINPSARYEITDYNDKTNEFNNKVDDIDSNNPSFLRLNLLMLQQDRPKSATLDRKLYKKSHLQQIQNLKLKGNQTQNTCHSMVLDPNSVMSQSKMPESLISNLQVDKVEIEKEAQSTRELQSYRPKSDMDKSVQYSERNDLAVHAPNNDRDSVLITNEKDHQLSHRPQSLLPSQRTPQHLSGFQIIAQEVERLTEQQEQFHSGDTTTAKKSLIPSRLIQQHSQSMNQTIRTVHFNHQTSSSHAQTMNKYSPSKKYSFLTKQMDQMRDLAEDLRYKEYLKRVEILNQKKAYLSTYRFVLTKEAKTALINEIKEKEAKIEAEEKLMFINNQKQ